VDFLGVLLAMTMQIPSPGKKPIGPDDYASARLAVMALRRVVGKTGLPDEYFLLPSERTLSREELVSALVLAPKPLTCAAHLISDRIAVQCATIQDQRRVEWRQSFRQRAAERLLDELKGAGIPEPLGCEIRVEDKTESLTVTVRAFLRWKADYVIAYAMGRRILSGEERTRRGVCGIFQFTGPASASMSEDATGSDTRN
jgi:hypothetical protein